MQGKISGIDLGSSYICSYVFIIALEIEPMNSWRKKNDGELSGVLPSFLKSVTILKGYESSWNFGVTSQTSSTLIYMEFGQSAISYETR